MASFVYTVIVLSLSSGHLVLASKVDLSELEYRTLDFELESLLKTFLKEWRYLTETQEVLDVGEVVSKSSLLEKGVLEDACVVFGKCRQNFDGSDGDESSTFPEAILISYQESKLGVGTESQHFSGVPSAAANLAEFAGLSDTNGPQERDSGFRQRRKLENATEKRKEGVIFSGRRGNDTPKVNRQQHLVLLKPHSTARETQDLETLNRVRNRTETQGKAGEIIRESEEQGFVPRRAKRSVRRAGVDRGGGGGAGGMPVIYMPGAGVKKTRKCAQVSGLLGGFNTFNYLTFVTGVLTLVLNANNNLNNNNNNNNLNNNNDISNNNVNSNTNTQNANQVVLFPPGRKRRSLTDLVLQIVTLPPSATTSEADSQDSREKKEVSSNNNNSSSSVCGAAVATEAASTMLQLFDAWVQASSGVGGDCGWAEYCRLLHQLPSKGGALRHALVNSLRSFSKVVTPQWLSSSSCLLHRARCNLL